MVIFYLRVQTLLSVCLSVYSVYACLGALSLSLLLTSRIATTTTNAASSLHLPFLLSLLSAPFDKLLRPSSCYSTSASLPFENFLFFLMSSLYHSLLLEKQKTIKSKKCSFLSGMKQALLSTPNSNFPLHPTRSPKHERQRKNVSSEKKTYVLGKSIHGYD